MKNNYVYTKKAMRKAFTDKLTELFSQGWTVANECDFTYAKPDIQATHLYNEKTKETFVLGWSWSSVIHFESGGAKYQLKEWFLSFVPSHSYHSYLSPYSRTPDFILKVYSLSCQGSYGVAKAYENIFLTLNNPEKFIENFRQKKDNKSSKTVVWEKDIVTEIKGFKKAKIQHTYSNSGGSNYRLVNKNGRVLYMHSWDYKHLKKSA